MRETNAGPPKVRQSTVVLAWTGAQVAESIGRAIMPSRQLKNGQREVARSTEDLGEAFKVCLRLTVTRMMLSIPNTSRDSKVRVELRCNDLSVVPSSASG